jgi:hypothetical protein
MRRLLLVALALSLLVTGAGCSSDEEAGSAAPGHHASGKASERGAVHTACAAYEKSLGTSTAQRAAGRRAAAAASDAAADDDAWQALADDLADARRQGIDDFDEVRRSEGDAAAGRFLQVLRARQLRIRAVCARVGVS